MSDVLAGKVVILTGAAGGQGRVASQLIADEGAKIALTDRDESGAALADAIGVDAVFMKHDVTDPTEWAHVVRAARDRFGTVDILINNAAIAGRDTIEMMTSDRLRGYIEVNVFGALNGIQAVLPAMRAGGGGAIVNIGSISALRATPRPGRLRDEQMGIARLDPQRSCGTRAGQHTRQSRPSRCGRCVDDGGRHGVRRQTSSHSPDTIGSCSSSGGDRTQRHLPCIGRRGLRDRS